MKPTLFIAGFFSALLSTDVAAQQGCKPIPKADSIVPPEVRQNCSGNMVMRCSFTFQCMVLLPKPKPRKREGTVDKELDPEPRSERVRN